MWFLKPGCERVPKQCDVAVTVGDKKTDCWDRFVWKNSCICFMLWDETIWHLLSFDQFPLKPSNGTVTGVATLCQMTSRRYLSAKPCTENCASIYLGPHLLTWLSFDFGMDGQSHSLPHVGVMTLPRPNFNGGLTKPLLNLGHVPLIQVDQITHQFHNPDTGLAHPC